MLRNWFWKIEEAGSGPDYLLVATFQPGDSARLAELVRAFPLPGFTLDDIVLNEEREHNTPSLRYLDAHTYQSLATQRDSGQRQNIYTFHDIHIQGAQLVIERGYGGYIGSACDASETDLAATLARSAEITLGSWEVRPGGDGATPGALASGQGSSSGTQLLDYLRPAEHSSAQE